MSNLRFLLFDSSIVSLAAWPPLASCISIGIGKEKAVIVLLVVLMGRAFKCYISRNELEFHVGRAGPMYWALGAVTPIGHGKSPKGAWARWAIFHNSLELKL